MSQKLLYTIYNSNGFYPVFENDINKVDNIIDNKSSNNYKINNNNISYVSQLDIKQLVNYLHR